MSTEIPPATVPVVGLAVSPAAPPSPATPPSPIATYALRWYERVRYSFGIVFAVLTAVMICLLCCAIWSGKVTEQPVGDEMQKVTYAQSARTHWDKESAAIPTSTQITSSKAKVVNNLIHWGALVAITCVGAWTAVKLLRED